MSVSSSVYMNKCLMNSSVSMWLESLKLVEINRPERRITARGESEFKLGPLTVTWDVILSATHCMMIRAGKSYKEVC